MPFSFVPVQKKHTVEGPSNRAERGVSNGGKMGAGETCVA